MLARFLAFDGFRPRHVGDARAPRRPPQARRWRSAGMLTVAAAALALAACGNSGAAAKPGLAWDASPWLAAVDAQVIAPGYQDFAHKAKSLHAATQALASAAATGAPAARKEAQQAWRVAAEAWARCDLWQLGPAGAAGTRVGGKGWRDRIYSWPIASACRVDQLVVSEGYAAAGFAASSLVNAIGLDVLEYLLFYEGDATQCPGPALPAADWAALDAPTRAARRAAYAVVVAAELQRQAEELRDSWLGAAGWGANLAGSGGGGSAYASTKVAVDELLAVMIWLETHTKDRKLADPTGASGSCPAGRCPERLESRWAGHDRALLAANLEGFSALFLAGDGATSAGLDAVLRARQAADTADAVKAAISKARAAIAAIEPSVAAELAAGGAKTDAALAAVDGVTDLFKGPVILALELQVPVEGAADND